jgi:acetyl esterase/lipase
MSALNARKRHMLLPCGMVLISPWLDLTLNETLISPAMATDFLVSFKDANPGIVNALLPSDIKPGDPGVSPIFDDLTSLPPQLVLAGTAEVLLPDSINWARKSREAGNEVELILGKGQMHT